MSLYEDELQKRRKQILGNLATPSPSTSTTTQPQKNYTASQDASLEERRKQILQTQTKPIVQNTPPPAAPTPTPPKPQSFLEKVGGAIKNVFNPPKPEPVVSPLPGSTTPPAPTNQQLVDLISQKGPEYKAQQDKYLKFPSFFPNPDFSQPQTSIESAIPTPQGQKKLETMFKNPVDTGIKATQDFISYHPDSFQFLADTQKFVENGLPNDKFSSAIASGVLPPLNLFGITKDDPLHRAILNVIAGTNKTTFGSSMLVRTTFDQRLAQPINPKHIIPFQAFPMQKSVNVNYDQAIDTVGQAIGGMIPYAVGTGITNAVGIPLKIGLPLVFSAIGQLSEDEAATVKQRLLKIPVDAITGYITSFIPGSQKGEQSLVQFAGKAFARANLSGGVFAGSAFLTSLIKGSNKEEAAKIAGSAYLTGMAFYMMSSSMGYLVDEITGTKVKSGSAVYDPIELEQRLQQSGQDKIPQSKPIMDAIAEAKKTGKNVIMDLTKFKQGVLYDLMGVNNLPTAEGKNTAAGGISFDVGVTSAAPKLPGSEEPLKDMTPVRSNVPAVIKQEVQPQVSPLNIPNLDTVTNAKIEELNKQDVNHPVSDGNVRVYQASPEGKPTDWVFKSPEELAAFMNNRTSEGEQFRYIDVPASEVQPVEGKQGVFKISPQTAEVAAQPKPETPVVKPEVPVVKAPVKETKNAIFLRNSGDYTSVKDFAQGEYSASPDTQVGFMKPSEIIARDPVDQAQVAKYQAEIQAGKTLEPIDIRMVDGKPETVDGTHRLIAYRKEGKPIPVINRSSVPIPGLSTLGEVYSQSTLQQVQTTQKSTPLADKAPSGVKVYHGTAANFDAFDNSLRGSITGAQSAQGAVWFTDSKEVAKGYAMHAAENGPVDKVLREMAIAEKVAQRSGLEKDWKAYDALVVKSEELASYDATFERRKLATVKTAIVNGDFYTVDAHGKTPLELSKDGNIDSWLNFQLDKARKLGKDGVIFKNLDDAAGLSNKPSTHYAVFDTKNVSLLPETKPSSGIEKNTEAFANLENVTKQLENTKPVIQFPEIMRMAEELMGHRPVVQKNDKGNYRGYFRPRGNGEIVLKPSLFKDPTQAAKTLAHEVGHLMDYLPDLSMDKGNLVGRIASLNNFLREKFSNPESEKKIDALIEKRKPIQLERKNQPKTEDGKPLDKKKDLELLKKIREINIQIKKLQETTMNNSTVKKELLQWSAKWRPVPGGSGTAADIVDDEYRASSKELYADAISGLFNDPERLKLEAPEFWKGFFDYLNRKPEVEKNLMATWDLLNQGPEAIFNARDKAMDESYKKAEEKFYAKEVERQKRSVSLLFQLQTLFDNKNQAIINKVKEAGKKGFKIEDGVNPMYDLAGLNYLDGKLKNYVMETFQPVFELAQSVPDGWNTLGKVLQLERTINERGEMANPGGLDPITAKDQLAGLEKATDPADWKIIQEAVGKFRESVQRSIADAEKAGFYTPDLIKEMKANPAYATFQVVDYLDTNISPHVYKSVGTLKDIANPATSTVMKTISLMKAIERNKVKVDSMDLLLKAFPEEIQPAKTRFTGKSISPMEPSDPALGLVTTLRDGKVTGYYVDRYIANTLKYNSNDTVKMAANIMRTVSLSKFYRPLFTGINLGFQSFNAVRDFMRYWKNVPDYTFARAISSLPRAVVRYAEAAPHAANRALGKPDDVIKAMENAQILGLNFNDLFKEPIDPEDTQIERVLQRTGILEKTVKRGVFTPIYKVLEGVETMGNFIESLPKIAGYLDLKGHMPEQELANFIRTKVGSPDFLQSGTFSPISNNIFLFSNAIKEGIKSDFEVATDPKTRSGFWWKTVVSSILPKFIMAAIGAGLLGKWAKDRMDDASEYDKSNYTVIPLSVDGDGKTVYLRVPQDETGRLLGALTWKILKTVTTKEAGIEDLMAIMAIGAGQFPNLSPSFTGVGAIIEYMSGLNPYDSFRARNVIPDQEFQAGPQYSLPIFVNWLLQNQGLGILIPSYVPNDPTTLQKVLNLPALSNIIGRWVKVSDYGQTEKLKSINAETTKAQAQEYIQRTQAVNDALKQFRATNRTEEDKKNVIHNLVTKVVGAGPYSGDRKTAADNLVKKFQVGLLKGQNPETDAIIYAPTNDARVAIFKELKKTMSTADFKDLVNGLHQEKVVSDQLVERLKKEL